MSGDWQLGMVPPAPLPPGKTLWLESEKSSKIDFEHVHLGAKYSFTNGSSLILRGLDLTGFEQFAIGTELETAVGYRTIPSSEAFWWQGGAEAALTNSTGIKQIILQGNTFDSTPLMLASGGGWWEGGFSPDHANPSIESALIEDNQILGHGGFDLRMVRFGDVAIRRNRFQNNLTMAELERFAALFPAERWIHGTGRGRTGSPIQSGLRICMRVGRTNYPYQGNDMYYYDSNGTVTIEDNVVDWVISDVAPSPSKRGGKHELHGIDVRGGTVIDNRNKIHNCMDLGFATDHAWAVDAKGINDGEDRYYKGAVTGGGGETINGSGEGPYAGKPFRSGTRIEGHTVRRDYSLVPDFAKPILDNLPTQDDKSGRRILEPGAVPMVSRAVFGPSPGAVYSGFRCHNFRVPPSGAENLIVTYDNHVMPTDTKIWDESGQLVLDIP